MVSRGKYIVIEGPQGVGKTTQLEQLAGRMRAGGLTVRTLKDPETESDLTSQAIAQLARNPSYPKIPRTDLLLTNAARSQLQETIKNDLEQGINCLVDRNYLTTLTKHFYGRGDTPDYYTINNVFDFAGGGLEPDLTIILDAPASTLKKRLSSDADEAFLERVRAGYLWEAKQRGYSLVYASQSVDEVANSVWRLAAQTLAARDKANTSSTPVSVQQVISKKLDSNEFIRRHTGEQANQPDHLTLLKAVARQPLPEYYMPRRMNRQAVKIFKNGLEDVLAKRVELLNKLKVAGLNDNEASWLTLPAACYYAYKNEASESSNELLKNAAVKLGGKHPKLNSDPVSLADYWPRNELSLVPALLFDYSDLASDELAQAIDSWSYSQKAKAVQAAGKDSTVLAAVGYSWEILTDFATMLAFEQQDGVEVTRQQLTPRYGFDTPESIEKTGLSDQFEACFDASVELFSKLQAAGYGAQAQMTTLAGHKHRIKVTMSARVLRQLQTNKSAIPSRLVIAMTEVIAPVHPLLTNLGDKTKKANAS